MTGIDSNGQFSEFYRANYSLILATVSRRLNDHGTAEDLTSEVFRVAWSHHINGDELTLPWLYGVARNIVRNEYRRMARSAALAEKIEGRTTGIAGYTDQDATDTRRAMMRLKESDREILFMAYWEDLSGAEIAAIVGSSLPTVWVRLNRARAALREELGASVVNTIDALRERGAR